MTLRLFVEPAMTFNIFQAGRPTNEVIVTSVESVTFRPSTTSIQTRVRIDQGMPRSAVIVFRSGYPPAFIITEDAGTNGGSYVIQCKDWNLL